MTENRHLASKEAAWSKFWEHILIINETVDAKATRQRVTGSVTGERDEDASNCLGGDDR